MSGKCLQADNRIDFAPELWYIYIAAVSNTSYNRKAGERMIQDMTAAEATNIIIRLTQEGWDANKINEFIVFIETHKPSEDEAINILKNRK